MKLTWFLVLIFTLPMSASVWSQTMSVKLKNATLQELFLKIENSSNYRFFYNNDEVDVSQRVTVDAEGKSVAKILTAAFEGLPYSFKELDNKVILIERTSATSNVLNSSNQQQKTVSGKVTDSSGSTLPGVSVVVKGTTTGTIADSNGNYSLSNIPENATLQFSFVGMKGQEVAVGSKTTINVVLEEETIGILEVVAIGYGTIKKSDLTGAVASIDNSKLEEIPITSFAQALQGALPGINIINTSASAEGGQKIQIRGKNSITANNSPLVVIDGVPYAGALSEINTNDIQSIDILKDASSSSIYGARGSNGVILITTKKGKKGAPKISYDGYYGIQDIAFMPEVMTADQFYDFKLERERNNAKNQTLTPEQAFTDSELVAYRSGNTPNWIKEATRLGSQQQQNLSVVGGTENTNYFISGSWLTVKGIAKNDDFNRLTVRFNFSSKITDWLEFGTNTQLSETDRGNDPANFTNAFYMNPLSRAYNDDGTITIYPWPEDIFSNPLSGLNNIRDDKLRRVFTNNYLDVKLNFLKGLGYRLNTGYNFRNRKIGTYQGRNTVPGFVNGGVSNVTNGVTTDLLVENILSYANDFNNHSVNATLLYSYQKFNDETHEIQSQGFPNDVMTYFQPGLGSLIVPTAEYMNQNYISYMGRFSYTYAGKYLLTATGRRDGYSAFGKDNKFGFFPSFAAGWHIGEEPFMKSLNCLEFLKLRISYGENGNQAIAPYRTLARMSDDAYLGGTDGKTVLYGFYPSSLGTSNLSWETTQSMNLGIDFGIFNNRLIGNIEYYKAITSDLLLNRTISPVHGASNTILQNIGKVKNNGLEIGLSSVNIRKNDIEWSSTLSVTLNRNKIVDLYGDKKDDIASEWFIGKPVDVNYDYVINGNWQETDDIANGPQPDASPGDIKIKDSNNDGTINNLDKEIIGSLEPDFIAGLSNEFSYKNFKLSIFLYTVQGVSKQNTLLEPHQIWPDTRRNAVYRNDYWTPENKSNTYPANRENTNILFAGFYEDASFIRCKDINLSYDFKAGKIQKFGLNNLKIYLNITNLFTITKWTALDPELGSQRDIPLNRTFLVGVKFGL